MDRRGILKSALLAGAAPVIAGCAGRGNSGDISRPQSAAPVPLVNDTWAREVMRRENLDGLIAMSAVNVYYLSSYTSFYRRMQVPNESFAVFPRAENRSAYLVTSSADAWSISNNKNAHPPIITYSQPAQWEAYLDQEQWPSEPPATPEFGSIWPRAEASLSQREQAWLDADADIHPVVSPSSVYALVRALKEAGLEKGRLAVDDMRVADLLRSVGFDKVVFVAGENTFRKIRVVKSPAEIEKMRAVAVANQAAAMAAIARFDLGANENDINHLFETEAARRGAKAMWLVAGGVGGLRSGEIARGEPILFDAVSQIQNYHGDFGRTVVVGEPTDKLLKRIQLIRAGWHAAFETLRPGVRYSDIQKNARAAMKKTGLPSARIGVTPHSVGLQHTDEPYRDGLPFIVKDDLVLTENMTLTVDFPSMELGWGSCHLEDLVVITKDGAEPLATMDDPLVVV